MQGESVERVLAVAAGAGQLQVQAVAERTAPVGQPGLGQFMAAGDGQASGQALAADEGEQAGVVLAQPFRAQGHAVGAVAFHPGAAEQAREA